eukprot:Gb_08545 [translate_table: standard]
MNNQIFRFSKYKEAFINIAGSPAKCSQN